jgi:PAS domain S-box-containing protein
MSTIGTHAASSAPFHAGASWDERLFRGHSVQFYDDDNFLLDGLSQYVGAALMAGDSAVVVATKPHRDGLAKRLTGRGLDVGPAVRAGRYLCLDTTETLSKYMVDGLPDRTRFFRVFGDAITQLGAAAQGAHPRIAAFGEMVAVLWAEGRKDAAIQLEQLWNELAQTYSFQLHCAYPMRFFSQKGDGALLEKICAEHSHTVPAEDYMSLATDEERRRCILFLQQKAQSLQTEILERKRIDQALRESEERLLLAQEVAGIGSFEWDFETEVYRCTPAWEAMYGVPQGFVCTREAWEGLLHPDDKEETMKLVHAGFETGAPVEGEWRVVWLDGSIRWIAGKWQVFKDEFGRPVRVSGVNIDITERKRAEEASLQLAAIVQSANDAIVSKDLNSIVTSWNPSAEKMLGYRAGEIVGRSILLIVPPELHHEEPEIQAKIRAGERIEHFETVRLRKDGERLNVSLTISPIRNQSGQITGIAKIMRDVTHQKKLEESLHTNEKLVAVGRLAATIAHEINNPLEAVTNFIYLAKEQPHLPDEISNYLKSADRELRRVSHIARQTLGFYRDDSQPVEFRVADAIESVLTIYESRFKYKALRIEKEIQAGLRVCTVEGEFKQILSNLIANAIDASRDSGRIVIRVRATRHLQSGRDGIRVVVADDGAGISPEDKQKLFTPFFTTKKETGTGLGLWITKDLIEKKKGCIRFHSRPRSGTTMSLFIPTQFPVYSRIAV